MSSKEKCGGAPPRRRAVTLHVTLLALLALPSAASAQDVRRAVSLRTLVEEAEQHNPSIAASRFAWQAGRHVPAQERALPGPDVTVQQFSVGSPRPFAGFSSSDFAYIALGVSQELPYPGKRALRGEVADHAAEALHAQSDAVARDVVEALKLAYVQLASIQQTLPILDRNDRVLTQVREIAESRYRVGQGSQQDVLKAQLQHTKILQEVASRRQDEGILQAQLKALLGRTQDSPDIVTEPLAPTPVTGTAPDLLHRAREGNPDLQAQAAALAREQTSVALAHKGFKPDFAAQYMYQHTARRFRDYYMATFSVRLPNRGRQRAALAQAEAQQREAAAELEAERQRVLAGAQQQYVAIQGSSQRLTLYREGLVPQANATFQAAMAAYAADRQDFETLLSAFLDVLTTEIAYLRELADHESAVARLERLTGDIRP